MAVPADPAVAERVEAAQTCADLEAVATDARDPGPLDPELMTEVMQMDPDSPRYKEHFDGLIDQVRVSARARELAC